MENAYDRLMDIKAFKPDDSEEGALELALNTCGLREPEKARIIRIENPLKLENLSVSKTVYEEIENRVEIL